MLEWIINVKGQNAKEIIAKIEGLGLTVTQKVNKLYVTTNGVEELYNFAMLEF